MALADVLMSIALTYLVTESGRRNRAQPEPPLPVPPLPIPPVPPRPPNAVPPPSYQTASTSVPWPKGDYVPAEVMSTPELAQRTVPKQPKPTPQSATNPFLLKQSGNAAPQTEEAAIIARERKPLDREYWRPRAKPSGAEIKQAVALLKQWKPGLVIYLGPRTFTGRRQYRAAMHGKKKAIEVWEPAPPFV